MKKALAALAVLLTVPALNAAELELIGSLGYSFPFYSQTFPYDSGPIDIPLPGLEINQGGEFELKGSGGLVLGGAATVYASEGFGFEVRLDSADMAVDTLSNGYIIRADLPSPSDPVTTELELDRSQADLKALTPWSFNIKLRSGGESLRLTASGGLSRLGNVEFAIDQMVSLGVVEVDVETGELDVATIRLRSASAVESESSWGGNLGLGIQIGIGERGALVLEGRAFYFPKRTYEWERATDESLPPLQESLLERVLQQLDPVEFSPWWAQASVGFAIRF
ncbi:MAG: hypothetical protein LJF30_22030 [Acidobacteria bacterium]|jgi:hypothetical protein|nr:hypothetical protein [Acidobacteriota bacterium]